MALSVKAAALVSFCLSALFCGNQLRYSTSYRNMDVPAKRHEVRGDELRALIHSLVQQDSNSTSSVDSHRRAAPLGSRGVHHEGLMQNGSLPVRQQVAANRTEGGKPEKSVLSQKPVLGFKLVHQVNYEREISSPAKKTRQDDTPDTLREFEIRKSPSQLFEKEANKLQRDSYQDKQKKLSMEYLLDNSYVPDFSNVYNKPKRRPSSYPQSKNISTRPSLGNHLSTGELQALPESYTKSENISAKPSLGGSQTKGELLQGTSPDEQEPRIPHILHQTWDSDQVPDLFSGWMRSWAANHPDWQYWFWTQEDVRLFLTRFYPGFLPEYEAYDKDIYRANAMRFYIMYHFGGVYADLDLESLKPMDFWTFTEDCILPEETHAHPIILRQQDRSNAMITLLACRPHHPFYKLAIDMLPMYKDLDYGDKLLFIDKVYQNFTSVNHSGNETVKLVHPDYFLPTYDQGWTARIRAICQNRDSLRTEEREVCDKLGKSDFRNSPKPYSYTNHHWIHVVMLSETWKKKNTRSVSNIIPNRKDMQSFLKKL